MRSQNECASVFLSDIIEFTKLRGWLDSDELELFSFLTRLFAKFDAPAQLHWVQKVKVPVTVNSTLTRRLSIAH